MESIPRIKQETAEDIHAEMTNAINHALLQFITQKKKETGIPARQLMGASVAALLRCACIQSAAVAEARDGESLRWAKVLGGMLEKLVQDEINR